MAFKYSVELIPVTGEDRLYKGDWTFITSKPHLIAFNMHGVGQVFFENGTIWPVVDHAKSNTVNLLYFREALLVTCQMPLEDLPAEAIHYEHVVLQFPPESEEVKGQVYMIIEGIQQVFNVQGKLVG